MNLKSTISRNLVNIPGFRTNRKIVVIESDDWGSIRMASQKSFNRLLAKGIRVDNSLYDSLDSLEKKRIYQPCFMFYKITQQLIMFHPCLHLIR